MDSKRTKWLRRRLEEIDGDLDDARERGLTTSLAAFHHQARMCRDALDESIREDEARAAAAAATQAAAPVSMADALADAMALPLPERRALLREIADGLGLPLGDGPALRVVGGAQ